MYTAVDPNNLPLPLRPPARGCAVTIGNFDGVHIGHQALIRRTVEKAAAEALPSVVITFSPHPLAVVPGRSAPPLLMTPGRKTACFAALGVDLALTMPFTPETAKLAPEDFVRDVLVGALNIKALTVGYDYAFGKGRRGNAELLTKLGEIQGFSVERLAPVRLDGATVSSSRIRELLSAGDVRRAGAFLGRPYSVEGTVEHGMNRGGRLLGFPTANLRAEGDILLPKTGVYAVCGEVGDPQGGSRLYKGVANVGVNPTFGNEALRVETHLLDFTGDIYGAPFGVHFLERLRDEEKFSGPDELAARIRLDVEAARQLPAYSTPCTLSCGGIPAKAPL